MKLLDVLDTIWTTFISIPTRIRQTYQTIKRVIFYGFHLRYNYDYDGSYIYDMLHLKLTRLYDNFLNHGHCTWCEPENNQMRKLAEARELAKKLAANYYQENYTDVASKYKCKEDSNDFMSELRKELYPDAEIIDRDEYVIKIRRAITRDQNEEKADRERLFLLLTTYINFWWD